MKIKYEFVTGDAVEIEVDEKWANIVLELNRREFNINQTETRRHESYEDEGEWAVDRGSDIDSVMEQKELTVKYETAMADMTAEQKDLIENVFMESMKKKEYAAKCGISSVAVSQRIGRIRKKFKKVLP